ncbi:response regulator [Dasania marina]|uniref:response regulator n=1 Tax=Dasania marina TaxID=471499 RepID=UPI000378B9BF|nr:response regulator [Dasania marina]
MRLLVVEDDDVLRQMMAEKLMHEGYEVVTAVDGEDAIRQIAKQYFDCVLTDIFMPNRDGYEVIQALTNSGLATKIIAISGMPETTEMGKDCLKIATILGSHSVIRKPFDFADLLQTVNDLVAGASLYKRI